MIYISGYQNRLLNFADDNIISAVENIIENLISSLEQDSQAAFDWFKINEMIVNSDKKIQAIVVTKNCRMKDSCILNISNQNINSENCVKLLWIEIDNTLSFGEHVSNLCKKASNQLNEIGRINKYMGFKETEVLLNSFVLSNFNYYPLAWHFSSSKLLKKIENTRASA